MRAREFPIMERHIIDEKKQQLLKAIEDLNSRLKSALKNKSGRSEEDILHSIQFNRNMSPAELSESLGWPIGLKNELIFILFSSPPKGKLALENNEPELILREKLRALRKLFKKTGLTPERDKGNVESFKNLRRGAKIVLSEDPKYKFIHKKK